MPRKKKTRPKADRNFEIGELILQRFWLCGQISSMETILANWKRRRDDINRRIVELREEEKP